eukprot:jgi/Chlat1/9000/Chrsp94S08338
MPARDGRSGSGSGADGAHSRSTSAGDSPGGSQISAEELEQVSGSMSTLALAPSGPRTIADEGTIWVQVVGGEVLEIDAACALLSPLLQTGQLRGAGKSRERPLVLPKQVGTDILQLILTYCTYHRAPGRSDKERKIFDEKLVRGCDTRRLCELTGAADALGMRPLEEKLEPLRNTGDDPRIRLLNRLYAKKRKELQERKGPKEEIPKEPDAHKTLTDERSVDDLLSFIDGTGKSQNGKAKGKKRGKKKNESDRGGGKKGASSGSQSAHHFLDNDGDDYDGLDPEIKEKLDREVADFARRLNADWRERMREMLEESMDGSQASSPTALLRSDSPTSATFAGSDGEGHDASPGEGRFYEQIGNGSHEVRSKGLATSIANCVSELQLQSTSNHTSSRHKANGVHSVLTEADAIPSGSSWQSDSSASSRKRSAPLASCSFLKLGLGDPAFNDLDLDLADSLTSSACEHPPSMAWLQTAEAASGLELFDHFPDDLPSTLAEHHHYNGSRPQLSPLLLSPFQTNRFPAELRTDPHLRPEDIEQISCFLNGFLEHMGLGNKLMVVKTDSSCSTDASEQRFTRQLYPAVNTRTIASNGSGWSMSLPLSTASVTLAVTRTPQD